MRIIPDIGQYLPLHVVALVNRSLFQEANYQSEWCWHHQANASLSLSSKHHIAALHFTEKTIFYHLINHVQRCCDSKGSGL